MMPNSHSQGHLWIYPKDDSEWHQTIVKELNIHPITAQILVSRGFKTIEEINEYLYGKLPNLFDPHLFPDMDKAVERIEKALTEKENILIYGDNDVDGITATALLTEFLTFIGGNVFYYIPNRTSLKQSLIADAFDYATKNNCKLLITVDCGITAATEIQEAAPKNVDVIVTDHHEPTAKLPHCVATLNPKLLNSPYPNRGLCGVGVAFKLAHAITNALTSNNELSPAKIDLKRYLDLVALGTIADMGSLLGENRILVRYGLRQMKRTKRIGLTKLFQVCDIDYTTDISPLDIASKVAPRLNSLGRIADPAKGVKLLLIRDPGEAEALAKELDLNNVERQRIERKDSEDIENYIIRHPDALSEKGIILSSEKWHPGIIPIITARIAKQYNRPTIIISIENGLGKGSIRTISEFPLLSFLKENSDLLENFGGHDYAAGLTIKIEHVEQFKKNFFKAVSNALKDSDIRPKIALDSSVKFADLTFDLMDSFNLLEPYGNENPAPLLFTKAKQHWAPKIVGKSHLKLFLEQEDRVLEAIAFNMADRKGELLKRNLTLELALTPTVSTFNNKASIQLQIRDFKVVD